MSRVSRPGRPKQAPPPIPEAAVNRDAGFSAARCAMAIQAAKTLSTFAGERGKWDDRIRYWQAQLAFAERRESVGAPHGRP